MVSPSTDAMENHGTDTHGEREVLYGDGSAVSNWQAPDDAVLRHGPIRPGVSQYNFSGFRTWNNWYVERAEEPHENIRDRTNVKRQAVRLWDVNQYPTVIPPWQYGSDPAQLMAGNYNSNRNEVRDFQDWASRTGG